MEKNIKLKENNVLIFNILDSNNNPTGEHLTFDLEDVELPLRYHEITEKHQKNVKYVQNQFLIINKKQDIKNGNLLSNNEKAKLNVLKDFYDKEIKVFDGFLGPGGTKKLLNGRRPYYTMFEDIDEIIQQILPELNKNLISIEDKVNYKYNNLNVKEDNVLK